MHKAKKNSVFRVIFAHLKLLPLSSEKITASDISNFPVL